MIVNTQAADLELGSGGFDVVHVNLTRGLGGAGTDGAHVMKLNYSSLQHAVLPVGAAQKLHPSTLSPQTMKQLVAEARKHFDTIIIDTGPILGSIEASLVVAAADRLQRSVHGVHHGSLCTATRLRQVAPEVTARMAVSVFRSLALQDSLV